MANPSCVYVITDDNGACKVGVSQSPQRRLRQLQVGASRPLRLARYSKEPHVLAREVEAYAHWLLREAQMQGEWFRVTPDAAWVALIAAVTAVSTGRRAPERIAGPGREKLPDVMTLRLRAGTFDRIDAITPENKRGEWIRATIEAELRRRERTPKPKDPEG